MKKSILISIFLVLFAFSCSSKSNNADTSKENNKIKWAGIRIKLNIWINFKKLLDSGVYFNDII